MPLEAAELSKKPNRPPWTEEAKGGWRYLRALWSWDRRFPGFGHDTHGVENRDGAYYVQCLNKGATAA